MSILKKTLSYAERGKLSALARKRVKKGLWTTEIKVILQKEARFLTLAEINNAYNFSVSKVRILQILKEMAARGEIKKVEFYDGGTRYASNDLQLDEKLLESMT